MSYDENKFASLIDDILRNSDLNTISAKRIRKSLSETLGYDVSEHKRFDKIHDEVKQPDRLSAANPSSPLTSATSSPAKRAADDSDASEKPTPKKPKTEAKTKREPKTKKGKVSDENDDAAYAARLQAEENSRARPTRGGANTKKPVKRRKLKTPAKVKEDGDAESGSGAEPTKRRGGFHKSMGLSEPLAEMLGETRLSRPQTVKKIWEYVKARDLQDPEDKRQIRCDDAMRAVFKTDRVHMFTMNKLLNQNLYPLEDSEQDAEQDVSHNSARDTSHDKTQDGLQNGVQYPSEAKL
ncbi:hypothetical protein BDV97DRAFT_288925 [Delphinella strobiligena]|nr:hypothetical protein BDV97DRAFT_288925 [Delphinella strobiligena]